MTPGKKIALYRPLVLVETAPLRLGELSIVPDTTKLRHFVTGKCGFC